MDWPEVVVFDLFGTLIDPSSIRNVVSLRAADSNAFIRLWRAKQLEYTWLRSLMGRYVDFDAVTRQAFDYALRLQDLPRRSGPAKAAVRTLPVQVHWRCGGGFETRPAKAAVRTPPLQRFAATRLAKAFLRAQAFPEVIPALSQLSDRRLAVLSNGTRRMIDAALRHAGLRPFFRAVLSADSAKTYKPSPRVYRLVLKALRVSRSQVLFVSSNYWDAVGAQSFGFSSCWINRQNAPEDFLGVSPERIVSNLTEVRELVRGVSL